MSDAKKVFEGKHVRLLERGGWEFVERKNAKEAVAVVATTAGGELILTEQYRRAVDAHVIDLPAGLIGDEDPEIGPAETAAKELEEEAGFTCSGVELLSRGPSSPGITSEIINFYRARDPQRKGDGGGVDGEDIVVHLIHTSGIRKWLSDKEASGVLIDLKVWGALYWAG